MSRLTTSLLSLVPLLLACQPKSVALTDADKAAIHAADQQFAQLAIAKNWSQLMGLYGENATMMPPNNPVLKGRAAIQTWMEGYPPISAFTLDDQEIDGLGDLAYVRGAYTITITPPGAPGPITDHGKFLEVLRKQANGSWQLTNDIFNSDEPVPAPAPAPAPPKRK